MSASEERWSVFGFREDLRWWRVYDSRMDDAPMTEEWARAAARDLNSGPSPIAPFSVTYEAHPYGWVGSGPPAVGGCP